MKFQKVIGQVSARHARLIGEGKETCFRVKSIAGCPVNLIKISYLPVNPTVAPEYYKSLIGQCFREVTYQFRNDILHPVLHGLTSPDLLKVLV